MLPSSIGWLKAYEYKPHLYGAVASPNTVLALAGGVP
jgi:hypothetical protein